MMMMMMMILSRAPYSHSSFIHLWKQSTFSSKIAAAYTRQSEML